jgi:hypothetical protein
MVQFWLPAVSNQRKKETNDRKKLVKHFDLLQNLEEFGLDFILGERFNSVPVVS